MDIHLIHSIASAWNEKLIMLFDLFIIIIILSSSACIYTNGKVTNNRQLSGHQEHNRTKENHQHNK